MELNLSTRQINYCKLIQKTTICQEETAETIVPDNCPDVSRIIGTNGVILLRSKECQETRASISGSVKSRVVYIPEDGIEPRALEISIPFNSAVEDVNISSESHLIVKPFIKSIDSRAINSRKVMVRVNIALYIEIYVEAEQTYCIGVENAAENNIQIQTQECIASFPSCIKEKSFVVSDEMDLGSSKPPASEICRSDVAIEISESKLIGSKAVFKGIAKIFVAYLTPEAELYSTDFQLPFSQLMELDEAQEEDKCEISMALTGMDLEVDKDSENSGSRFLLTLNVVAQAVVTSRRELVLVSDLYSTSHAVYSQMTEYSLEHMQSRQIQHENYRVGIDTEEAVRSVIDTAILAGPAVIAKDGNNAELTSETTISVTYMGEDGELYLASKNVEVSSRIDSNENNMYSVMPVVTGEVYAAPAADGMEVHFGVDFDVAAQNAIQMAALESANVEVMPEKEVDVPSVVMRFMDGGEGLWDIAKAYQTTMEAIRSANNLSEDEALEQGRALLIPRKR